MGAGGVGDTGVIYQGGGFPDADAGTVRALEGVEGKPFLKAHKRGYVEAKAVVREDAADEEPECGNRVSGLQTLSREGIEHTYLQLVRHL